MNNNCDRAAHHGGVYNVLAGCTSIIPCLVPSDIADVKDWSDTE